MTPKVKFLCLVPGVKEAYPVRPISYFRPEWLDKKATEYAGMRQAYKRNPWEMVDNGMNIAKCVGIRKLYTTGWVITTWQDIVIDNNLETGKLDWRSAIDQAKHHPDLGPAVSFHNRNTFSGCPHLAKNPHILKISSPWVVQIPKGYSMLQQGLPYQEHDFYEAATGIFPSDMGLMQVNTQLIWKAPGQTVIPAGTPMAYITLIKDEEIEEEMRYFTSEEKKVYDAQRTIMDSSFERNYTEIRRSIAETMDGLNEQ